MSLTARPGMFKGRHPSNRFRLYVTFFQCFRCLVSLVSLWIVMMPPRSALVFRSKSPHQRLDRPPSANMASFICAPPISLSARYYTRCEKACRFQNTAVGHEWSWCSHHVTGRGLRIARCHGITVLVLGVRLNMFHGI